MAMERHFWSFGRRVFTGTIDLERLEMIQIVNLLLKCHLQWKYRIECTELLAAAQGLFGLRIAKDVRHNRLMNDVGSRNTNKAMDLKVCYISGLESLKKSLLMQVEHENKVWKERAKGLKGNYTDHSLQLIARYYLNNF